MQPLQNRFPSPTEASFGLAGAAFTDSVATSAMSNRRWYRVSRLAPEQIKASRHPVDPWMTVPSLSTRRQTRP